ncbi:MAG TPA: hypothetical protein VJU87_11045 [Gemmatimonadaceae bacterium]|nr:hypothetical protein [Gemmatimonadaceae bacterium]
MLRLLFVFTLHAPHSADHPGGDSWFAADKAKHFFLSAFVQSVAYSAARESGMAHGAALGAASATTVAVGVGKEIRDAKTGGGVSLRDLVWDLAGGVAATVVLQHSVR